MTPDALRALIAFARSHPRMVADNAVDLRGLLYERVQRVSGADIGAAWCAAYPTPSPSALSDAEACDVALRAVDALWPQGDAPTGDECAAYSAAPLDTPMPPAFVAALASLSPAQPRALDLGALHARVTLPTCSQCGAVDPPTEPAESLLGERFARHVDCPKRDPLFASNVAPHGLTRAEQRDLVAALRDREREVADYDALVQRQGALLLATAAALKGPPPPLSQHSAHDLPEVAALVARLAAAQPAPLDFHGALAAVRNGRFVPSSAWARCLACDGTCADVDGAPCEPCRGTGRHPPPDPAEATDDVFEELARAWNADTDLCPKCGALDLDHTVEECARRWAEQHPGAAAGIVGAERAPRGET